MDAYDLDDTLAATNYKQAGHVGMEELYANAPVIYRPETPFVVITGRPIKTQAEREATRQWLIKNEPNHRKIYYVTGSEKERTAQKADIISRLNLTTYTDNNPNVLSKMRELLPNVKLFLMQGGKRTPF